MQWYCVKKKRRTQHCHGFEGGLETVREGEKMSVGARSPVGVSGPGFRRRVRGRSQFEKTSALPRLKECWARLHGVT